MLYVVDIINSTLKGNIFEQNCYHIIFIYVFDNYSSYKINLILFKFFPHTLTNSVKTPKTSRGGDVQTHLPPVGRPGDRQEARGISPSSSSVASIILLPIHTSLHVSIHSFPKRRPSRKTHTCACVHARILRVSALAVHPLTRGAETELTGG